MAVAAALVTGRIAWQRITFVQVAASALWVIAIGFAVSIVIPDPLPITPSIDARTSPGLLDLGVALAAGAAGAWVTVRKTGTDALPGVAIAVSLVPPLATVGICLELGLIDDAGGALILFLTNLAAIILASVVVFLAVRAGPTIDMVRERSRLRAGVVIAAVGLLLISIPLALHTYGTVAHTARVRAAAPIVDDWLGDRDLEITRYSVDGGAAFIEVTGPDAPPDTGSLARALAAAWGIPVSLEVGWINRQHQEAASP
jgi:uncharacterized membrane protein